MVRRLRRDAQEGSWGGGGERKGRGEKNSSVCNDLTIYPILG